MADDSDAARQATKNAERERRLQAALCRQRAPDDGGDVGERPSQRRRVETPSIARAISPPRTLPAAHDVVEIISDDESLEPPPAATVASATTIDLDKETPLTASKAKGTPPLRFRAGTVALTQVAGHRKEAHHLNFEELLERKKLRCAVLSTWAIDPDWLRSKIDLDTEAYLVLGKPYKNEDLQNMRRTLQHYRFTPILAPLPPSDWHKNHAKLQLLFFDTHVRVVVPSANLISSDWGEPVTADFRGDIENIIYVQDFPLQKPVTADDDTDDESPSGGDDFLQELVHIARAMEFPTPLVKRLHDYCYDAAHGVRLVNSIGHNVYRDDAKHSGMGRLSIAARSLGLSLGDASVDYMTSSLGNLDRKFLHNLLRACRGEETEVKPKITTAESDREQQSLRIIFPSLQTVERSVRGVHSGDTNRLKRAHYEGANFPSSRLFDYVGKRAGILSHCKIIVVRSRSDASIGYAYVGSANCSSSAWSSGLSQSKQDKEPSIFCRSYEVGVLVPLHMIQGRLPYRDDVWRKNEEPWFADEHL